MLGHLKAADFVNLLDGVELSRKHRMHIQTCARCRATWESVRSLHTEIEETVDTTMPEPDWTQFRSSVRDELLSRSIQRDSAVRRWTGWTIRPAMAWALSLFMAIGITTVTVVWKVEHHVTQPSADVSAGLVTEPAAADLSSEVVEAGPERSLFDDLVSLGEDEQEQLRQLLESDQKGVGNTQ
jgi:hypothetical protein